MSQIKLGCNEAGSARFDTTLYVLCPYQRLQSWMHGCEFFEGSEILDKKVSCILSRSTRWDTRLRVFQRVCKIGQKGFQGLRGGIRAFQDLHSGLQGF